MKSSKVFTLATALFLFISLPLLGQGLETFNNFTYTGTSYTDGAFEGENGIVWSYTHVTGQQSFPIDGNGMLLRRSGGGSTIISDYIPGGIGNFSVQLRKAFTSTGVRQVELFINGESQGVSLEFGADSGADETVHLFEVPNINIEGNFTLEIRHITGGDQNRQLVIDNINWTGYTGNGMPTVVTPSFNPPAGTYLDPISVVISTETENATIRFTTDGSDPDESSEIFNPENPIELAQSVTLKARAYKENYHPSMIRTANYNFLTTVQVADIATLKASPEDGTVYQITGEVVLSFAQSFRNQKFIQDHTAGILIDDNTNVITNQYNIGDGIVNLTGTLSTYGNMVQFVPVVNSGPASSQGNQIVPVVITMSDFINDFMTYQSQLVTLENVHFTTADGTETFANGQIYPISDGTTTVEFRTTFFGVDYITEVIPTETISITGILNSRSEGDFITPRDSADLYSETSVDLPLMSRTELIGNYPNPFNPSTTISFYLESGGETNLSIYNIRGQKVRDLVSGYINAGNYQIIWDGKDNMRKDMSSGVYFYRLETAGRVEMKKAMLLK